MKTLKWESKKQQAGGLHKLVESGTFRVFAEVLVTGTKVRIDIQEGMDDTAVEALKAAVGSAVKAAGDKPVDKVNAVDAKPATE